MSLGALKDEADLERFMDGKLEDRRLLPNNPPGLIKTDQIEDGAITDEKLASPVIRGAITSGGEIESGTGFTCEKTGTGLYKITLTTELATIGAMMAMPVASASLWRQEAAFQKKEFTLQFTNISGVAQSTAFTFLVVEC